MSLPRALVSALAGEVKLPSASAILGELGTILMSVLATLVNLHTIAVPTPAIVALTVVAGVLVSTHVVSAKWAETVLAKIEADLHVTAAQTKAAADAASAAHAMGQAASLVTALHGAVDQAAK